MELVNRIKYNFNGRLTFTVLFIAVSSFNYGFDNGAFSTTQAMNSFDKQFGVLDSKGAYALQAYWLSLYTSVIFAGMAIGVVVGSAISARFGRRVATFCLCIWVMIATTVIISASNKWQLLVGRIMFNGYMGMELATIPVYQSEIVPAPARGLVLSTYQYSQDIGGLIMQCICLGTSTLTSSAAYRIPFGLFYMSPLIVLGALHWIPESPRWLLLQGRRDEALEVLRQLRVGKRTDDEILLEFQAIETTLQNEPEKGRYRDLWRRDTIKRTGIVVGINFFQEFSGDAVVSKFGAIIVKDIGTVDTFVITVVFAVAALVTAFFTMTLSDRIGRRPFLLASTSVMSMSLLALGAIGCYDYTGNKTLGAAAIFLLVMVTVGFELGLGCLTNVVMTEVVSLRLRDMSQRTAGFARVVANFTSGFSLPYAIDSIGLKLGFIWGSFAACATVFVYFCVPECRRRSLETVERMFRAGIPIRKFGSYNGDLDNFTVEHVIEEAHVHGKEASFDEHMYGKDPGEKIREDDPSADLSDRS